ncbi:TonB-dependent receptor domain-containing protein [Marinifilum fragile]|uniref:TonB-dependent receptor plug domain-containing protein n=1 Tax=Marinifilum fragile TaxID=570161 RepID=UPI002AA62A45|nr:TonB-dependent receptor [Marinifilum fragile]
MKKNIVTAFALLSIFNFSLKAEENPENATDTTSVRHLNLSEVKVNASRVNAKMKDLPQKVDVISKRVIESSPATDIAGLLKSNGAIDIQQYPGVNAGIGIRGFAASTSSKYAVILVNGKPAGTENIASIDLNNVERVEILKGPFSSQYGSDAMGGVVNIVTKESDGEFKGNVSFQYGSFDTFKENISIGGALSDGLDFDLSYAIHNQGKDYKVGDNNLYDEGYAKMILDPTTYGERIENSQLQKHTVIARLGVKLSDSWKLNLNGSYFKGKKIETPGTFWHIYGMDSKDMERYTTGFDLIGKQGNHNITFSPYYSEQEEENFDIGNDGYGDTKYTYKNYGFQLNDAIQLDDHVLAIGIDNNSQKYESLNYTTAGSLESPFQPDYYNIATGIYSQFQMKFLEGKFNVSVGGRGDNVKFKTKANSFLNNNSSSEDYWVFTKNIGVKYEVLEGFSVHSSWGDAFLAPSAFQVAGEYQTAFGKTIGKADLDPEKSNTWDLGIGFKNFAKGINFDITYFDTHHKDKIVQVRDADFNSTFDNADKADMNGLEILASYDFGALKDYEYSLRLYLNYTHIFDATEKVKVGESFVESKMKYVRDNNASFGIEFDNLKGFSTRLHGRYIGHRYEDNYMYAADYSNWPNVTRAPINFNGEEVRKDLIDEDVLRHPVYYVFDYSVNYQFHKHYSAGLTVANLLDENYSEKDGFNMPGRSIMLKVGYRF